MVMSGYLNAKETEDGGYELSIPNREMFNVYMEIISNSSGNQNMALNIKGLFRAMQSRDVTLMDGKIHETSSKRQYQRRCWITSTATGHI